jgi:hypothetical protein
MIAETYTVNWKRIQYIPFPIFFIYIVYIFQLISCCNFNYSIFLLYKGRQLPHKLFNRWYQLSQVNTSNISKSLVFLALWIRVITKLPNSEQSYKGKVKTHKYINRQSSQQPENCENRNDPDLVQAFPAVTITVFITILEQNR